MPLPFDNSARLQSASEIIKRVYAPGFLTVPFVQGSAALRLMKFDKEPVVGDGEYIKTEKWGADSFRFGLDALADFPDPQLFAFSEVKARFNESVPASNDFGRMAASVQVSEYQLGKISEEGQVVDMAQELVKNMKADFSRKLAAAMRLPRSGQIALVNAATYAKRKGDNIEYGECSSYTAGDTSMCVVVDGGAAAMFFEGAEYDLYTSAGALIFYRARCIRFNPGDPAGPSVVFERGGSTGDPATANFDSVADNHIFYFTGSRNAMPWTPEAWMRRDAAASTFIGAVDRNTPAYGYLNSTHLRRSTTNVAVTEAQISKAFFDQAADVVAQIFDSKQTYECHASVGLITALRAQFDQAALYNVPTTKTEGERQANLGSVSVAFQHPSIGTIMLEGDPFKASDHVDLLSKGDWRVKFYQNRDLKIMPGDGGLGNFYRMAAATSGAGKGMHYRQDAYFNFLSYCRRPKAQIRIGTLSAA